MMPIFSCDPRINYKGKANETVGSEPVREGINAATQSGHDLKNTGMDTWHTGPMKPPKRGPRQTPHTQPPQTRRG